MALLLVDFLFSPKRRIIIIKLYYFTYCIAFVLINWTEND